MYVQVLQCMQKQIYYLKLLINGRNYCQREVSMTNEISNACKKMHRCANKKWKNTVEVHKTGENTTKQTLPREIVRKAEALYEK